MSSLEDVRIELLEALGTYRVDDMMDLLRRIEDKVNEEECGWEEQHSDAIRRAVIDWSRKR